MSTLALQPVDPETKAAWSTAKCDKYDYLIAASCGAFAGVIDIFLVGVPGQSPLGKLTDSGADALVKDFASSDLIKKFGKQVGWKPRAGNEDNVASAIGFLERNFGVNYDQRHTADVDGLFNMSTRNHHFKSLSHSPGIVGLFFSILDQFTNTSSFLSDGKFIRIDTTEKSDVRLQGDTFSAKLIAGAFNWLAHIMSDVAGSSGSRGPTSTGRGSGVAIPFMQLFQLCNFGSFQVGKDKQTLAEVMTRVFQEGYDLRFGVAMAVPVILEECMIKTLWVIKTHYYSEKPWNECVPTSKHADLRIMLLVGNASLCIVDGADAAVRSGGNAVAFVLRLNLIAWAKLIILILKELAIRYGSVALEALKAFVRQVMEIATAAERRAIEEYHQRMMALDDALLRTHIAFSQGLEAEYQKLHKLLEEMFVANTTPEERIFLSVQFAQFNNVPEGKIIHNIAELDAFMTGG